MTDIYIREKYALSPEELHFQAVVTDNKFDQVKKENQSNCFTFRRMCIILPALYCVIYYIFFMKKNNQVYTYTDKDYPKVVNFEINENLTFA